jgi:hypothetical protein
MKIVTVPVAEVGGMNEYVYVPGAVAVRDAVSVTQLVLQSSRVTLCVDRTTGVPSA